MDYSIGGRGNQAPYDTTHVRVPVPIKELVQAASRHYRKTLNVPTLILETPLDEGDEEDQEDDNRSDPSDLETIELQAAKIRAYLSEINYLKHKLAQVDSQIPLSSALESARKIIEQKKSAKVSLTKLLTCIYSADITTDLLD